MKDRKDEELSPLEKAMGRVGDILKGRKKPMPTDDADQDDADLPSPSPDDAAKAAAPAKGAPPQGGDDPDQDGDDDSQDPDDQDDSQDPDDQDGDGKPDADEDDQDGQDQDPDQDDDDDQDEPDPAKDAALRKKVLQRSLESPDFFKSLLEGEDAERVAEMIDASDVVAFIVQSFSEQLASAHGANAALQKSLGATNKRLEMLEKGMAVTLDVLEKSMEGQDAILKGMGEQQDILKSYGMQDTGAVSHGLGTVAPAKRRDPAGDGKPLDGGDLPSAHKVREALMKSGGKYISREVASNLMANLNTQGVGPVLQTLRDNKEFQALLK